MRTDIVQRPLDACALLDEVAHDRNGASVLFVGTVRDVNDGAPVTGLDYSTYAGMAERELAAIASEASARWGTTDIVVEHRVGALGLGDASVVIAVGHPHRSEAYDASRYIIDELKKRLPIWKREHYLDGRSEWVENTGDVILSPSPVILSPSPVILSEAKDLRLRVNSAKDLAPLRAGSAKDLL